MTNQFGNRMVNVYGFGKERGKKYPSDEELLNSSRSGSRSSSRRNLPKRRRGPMQKRNEGRMDIGNCVVNNSIRRLWLR